MIELIIIILILLFFIINILLLYSLKRFPKHNYSLAQKLNFSIIIAAKNEEENLPGLINSLKSLNYPQEKFEIILVDDNSTDNTLKVANELTRDIDNFYAYKITGKKLPGKKGALTFGINKAKNPFIMITDADCLVNSNWLNIYSGYFSNEYDLLFGIAPFKQSNLLVNKISCFENLRSSILTFSAAQLKIPYSASARNFGFRKSSFEKINGYENTAETLSGDDDLLLREAVKNKFKIRAIIDKEASVLSSTKNTFKEYFNQKSRHTKTSFHYILRHKLFLGSWHILNLFFLLSVFLFFLNPIFRWLFIIKILIDILIISSIQKKFSYNFNIFEIFYLQILYEIFIIINFLSAVFRKDKWA